MLAARDHGSVLARLCAIQALRIMETEARTRGSREPSAAVALDRIAMLQPGILRERVWICADRHVWRSLDEIAADPKAELVRVKAVPIADEPPDLPTERPSLPYDPPYWSFDWREQE